MTEERSDAMPEGHGNAGTNGAATARVLLAALRERGLLADAAGAEDLARDIGAIPTPAEPSDAFTPAPITENAMVVLEKRYLRKDADGNIAEDADGMFRRVAGGLARVDREYGASDDEVAATADEFYRVMASLDFLPNSPTLMNAGTGAGTLSACFVLPLEDTMEGIMDAAKDTALVQKFGGGTGFALSKIRPRGRSISTTHGKSCGPVAVLRHLSSVSTLVTQGGKRDGANMAVMDVHHPDILEFIGCKEIEGEIHNFNISVGATDEFMAAVRDGTDYPLRALRDPNDPTTMEEVGRLDAREVFSRIVEGAWRNGEPGMIFLDEVNRNSPVRHLGEITATNPCGEQPLLPNESCNLGSINLARYVVPPAIPSPPGAVSKPPLPAGEGGGEGEPPAGRHPSSASGWPSHIPSPLGAVSKPPLPAGEGGGEGEPPAGRHPSSASGWQHTAPERAIDWEHLRATVRTTIHMLDNVIDANKYAVPPIERMTKATRKLGLGVMGFADMLVQLGIRYDSEEGIEIGRRVMAFIREEADKASRELARARGPFPAWEGSPPQQNGEPPLRNACRLTVAPTGTISMIAGCSSGIEPIFSLAFRKHNILGGETLYYVDRNFERVARARGFYSEDLMEFLADGGSLQERDDVPQDVKDLFRVASDISPAYHVRMQAAFQESTDAAISKTINFPNEATREDVETAYLMAWQLKCKGITVYRAGSREKEVLTKGTGEGQLEAASEVSETIPGYLTPRDRPSEVSGVTRRIRTGHGNMYITVNTNGGGRPFEVFAALGKAGGCDAAQHEAIGRMVSLALRSGIDPEAIIKELRGITCCPAWDNGTLVRSGPDAFAIALDRQVRSSPLAGPVADTQDTEGSQLGMAIPGSRLALGGAEARVVPDFSRGSGRDAAFEAMAVFNRALCPECGRPSLAHEEGCAKCHSCGYSKC